MYAAARDPSSVTLPGVVPVRLDVTEHAAIEALAHVAPDVSLLINNAGIIRAGGLLAADALGAARAELETNYFGPLAMSRAFAPIVARNVVTKTLAALEAGQEEILADELSRQVKHGLSAQPGVYLGAPAP